MLKSESLSPVAALRGSRTGRDVRYFWEAGKCLGVFLLDTFMLPHKAPWSKQIRRKSLFSLMTPKRLESVTSRKRGSTCQAWWLRRMLRAHILDHKHRAESSWGWRESLNLRSPPPGTYCPNNGSPSGCPASPARDEMTKCRRLWGYSLKTHPHFLSFPSLSFSFPPFLP